MINELVSLMSNHKGNTRLTRRTLNSIGSIANAELNLPTKVGGKCVESIQWASQVDEDVLRYSFEKRREQESGIVVGVNLISPVNNVVQTVTTPTYTSSVVSLTGVLPIIFVTVIILGAIAWMGFRD